LNDEAHTTRPHELICRSGSRVDHPAFAHSAS
jgi:hypothetical protein